MFNFIYQAQLSHSKFAQSIVHWPLAASWRPADYCLIALLPITAGSQLLQMKAGHLLEV